MRKIRVMVVDDSVLIRRLVSKALSQDPAIEVVATANNGRFALSKIPQYNPDLVTLDIEMPEMNGLEALAVIRKTYPSLPVIMFSALTSKDATKTLYSLELGANDFVTKSAMGKGDAAFDYLRENLIPKIKYFCREIQDIEPPVVSMLQPTPVTPRHAPHTSRVEIIVIGASTGGPNALLEIFPHLPEDLPPILIVQHMPPIFTAQFAKNLSMKSKVQVEEGRNMQRIRRGHAWIAPGDYHMALRRVGEDVVILTHKEPPENSCRPAADVLFRSAANIYGPNILAIILTGMGQDGLRGCELISKSGGHILAQDEASSVVWGMPGYVVQAGLAHKVVPLDKMAHEILNYVVRSEGTAYPSITKH